MSAQQEHEAAPSDRTTPAVSVNGQDPEKGANLEIPTEKSQVTGPAPATPAIGPPPDGGTQAWLVVLGAFCGLFVSFGWINCTSHLLEYTRNLSNHCPGIGVFQTYYESHQLNAYSTSTVTWITSLETFTMFFCVS